MTPEPLAFIGTSDLSGLLRGKSIPWSDLDRRLGRGLGMASSDLMISPFDHAPDISAGASGDLVIVPDPKTRASIPAADGPDIVLMLGDLLETDGTPWECCPRYFLRRALAALHAEFGLTLLAAFEQAFVYTGVGERAASPFSLDALRRQGAFGGLLLAAIRANALTPETFGADRGARQYKLTVAPAAGVAAADQAIVVRELARAVAAKLGQRAVLAPMPKPGGVGNGAAIHFSLLDEFARPAMYDEAGLDGLSEDAACFVAGILHHLPAVSAVTAPSPASFYRLNTELRTVFGAHDRTCAVRLGPIDATAEEPAAAQFNVVFSAADAASSPYLALGTLVWAGLDGLRRRRRLDGLGRIILPSSLAEALDQLEESVAVAEWFGPLFRETYLRFKRAELRSLEGVDQASICARYAAVY